MMKGLFFCSTEGGCIGAVSGAIREGDVVVVALGCTTPIALRPHGRKGHYQFIGDLYLHGYMDGKPCGSSKTDSGSSRSMFSARIEELLRARTRIGNPEVVVFARR